MAIKSTLVTPPNKAKEIDWSIEGQLVIDNLGQVLITTGGDCGDAFDAMPLVTVVKIKDQLLKESGGWVKEKFTPITTPITITFENE